MESRPPSIILWIKNEGQLQSEVKSNYSHSLVERLRFGFWPFDLLIHQNKQITLLLLIYKRKKAMWEKLSKMQYVYDWTGTWTCLNMCNKYALISNLCVSIPSHSDFTSSITCTMIRVGVRCSQMDPGPPRVLPIYFQIDSVVNLHLSRNQYFSHQSPSSSVLAVVWHGKSGSRGISIMCLRSSFSLTASTLCAQGVLCYGWIQASSYAALFNVSADYMPQLHWAWSFDIT